MSADPKFSDLLKTLTELQLSEEQEENFTELFFLLVQFSSMKKTDGAEDVLHNFETAIEQVEQKICSVRSEFERRDQFLAIHSETRKGITLASKKIELL